MLRIETIPVTPFQQNARIFYQSGDTSAVLVDPGGDAEIIIATLEQHRLVCKQIILTHSHVDHCGAVKALKSKYNAPLYGHQGEAFFRTVVKKSALMYGIEPDGFDDCPEPDHYLFGGETLSLLGVEWQVIFTPGHSPGHLSFYLPQEELVVAGDVLFRGSIGRTDLPGAHHKQLLESIESLVRILPNKTRVLSGHGPDTTIGEELRMNPFLDVIRSKLGKKQ